MQWRLSECMLQGFFIIYDIEHHEVCRVANREIARQIVEQHNRVEGSVAESG